MKQAESSAATKAALIDEFCKLYSALPLEKVTVKDISANAGVSRVTFYNYFADPYALLDELEDGFMDMCVKTARANIETQFVVPGVFQVFAKTLEQNEGLAKILFLGSHSEAFAGKIKDAVVPLAKELFGAQSDDKRVAYALEYHVSGMVALLRQWFFARDMGIDEAAMLIHELLVGGVLAAIKGELASHA